MHPQIEARLAELFEMDQYLERATLALLAAKKEPPEVREGLAIQRDEALKKVMRAQNDLLCEYRWQLRMRGGVYQ